MDAEAPPIKRLKADAPPKSAQGDLSTAELLDMPASSHTHVIIQWGKECKRFVDEALPGFIAKNKHKLNNMEVPKTPEMMTALAIQDNTVDGKVASFREVMQYDNLQASLTKTQRYEAAGTLWMLDPFTTLSENESLTLSQLDAARYPWTEACFNKSSTKHDMRRYCFSVPMPARVLMGSVAMRKKATSQDVVMAQPLPMIGGTATVLTWYCEMRDALRKGDNTRALALFEAALSVPILLLQCPDDDACILAAMHYSDTHATQASASGADSFFTFSARVSRLTSFADGRGEAMSHTKFLAELKRLGVTFKGKDMTEAGAKAIKNLLPFVADKGCQTSYSLCDSVCEEMREQTLLLRVAQLCTKRAANSVKENSSASGIGGGGDVRARALFSFVLDSLRCFRLTGDLPKQGGKLTVDTLTGLSASRMPTALANVIIKKLEFVEYLLHEARIIAPDGSLENQVDILSTPLSIMDEFMERGENGMIKQYFKDDKDDGLDLSTRFAVPVARRRDELVGHRNPKVLVLHDLLWGTWSKAHDEEFVELLEKENSNAPFFWHRYLTIDSSKDLGRKYKEFLATVQDGPIAAATGAGVGIGASEMPESQALEIQKTKDKLQQLRKQTVTFITLPSAGGATGPEFSKAQLQTIWGAMKLGHRYTKQKQHRRGFVLSAELFSPNVAKHGRPGSLAEPIACDTERMRRVLEFINQKRGRDDIVVLFDGRSKPCRKVIEEFETQFQAGGHQTTEMTYIYMQPAKTADPRVPSRSSAFSAQMMEIGMTVWHLSQGKANRMKVQVRGEFNSCGETSTVAKSYTGIPIRRMGELPRMEYDTKSSIVGAGAAGQPHGTRLQGDFEQRGQCFSFAEVKPLHLWQRLIEHHGLTHIIDFSPGTGALAIAAAGNATYEGIAANEEHQNWLDRTLDKCITYLVGRPTTGKVLASKIGGDEQFLQAVEQYCGGIQMDARRYIENLDGDEAYEASDDEDDEDL